MAISAYILRDLFATDYLVNGAVKAGERLPLTSVIAKRYGASLPTVLKAYGLVVHDGMAICRSRKYFATGGQRSTLSRSKSPRIGCLLVRMDSPIQSRIATGVERVAARNGFTLELGTHAWNLGKEKDLVRRMRDGGGSGLVLYPTSSRSHINEYLACEYRDFPIVVADLYQEAMMRSHVIIDNVTSGYQLARHFLKRGKRHLLFLSYPEQTALRSLEDRFEGFRRAMEEFSIAFHSSSILRFSTGRSWKQVFEEGMKQLFSRASLPEVIFAPTDKVAHEISLFLREKGIDVPGTVEICGADNLQEEGWHERFVTTRTDFTAVGQRAAEILIEQINNPAMTSSRVILPSSILLPPESLLFPLESSHPDDLDWASEIVAPKPVSTAI